MPAPWQTWKKTLSCKTDLEQVHEPRAGSGKSKNGKKGGRERKDREREGKDRERDREREREREKVDRKAPGSGACARSLKDVIHGNTRVMHKQSSSCSPVSRDSVSEFFDSVDNDVVGERGLLGVGGISSYCGTPISSSYVSRGTPLRRFSGCYDCTLGQGYEALEREAGVACDSPKPGCQKCGQLFNRVEALEQHQIIRHAVTELHPGDSSRNVVEIIFRTSWLKKEIPCGKIERILKVHNTQRTIAKFEEFRDAVKARANKLPKKHPRCMADGNELLRFYGTTVMCSLGYSGSTSLCFLPSCSVCQIIRQGFSSHRDEGKGIQTTSTSGKAHDSIAYWPGFDDDDVCKARRAMVVCRVIAGRVHTAAAGPDSLALDAHSSPPAGYDSVASDVGPYSNMGDLLVFNAKAVLPCFVVIYMV